MAPLYAPLDPSKSEIRLIEIISIEDSLVSCRLSTVSLLDKPIFAALSYVWGDPTIVEDIVVNDEHVKVTTNLAAALRRVIFHWSSYYPERDPSTFRVWADALCINQDDPIEQGIQIKGMGKLYETAEVVLGWLGDFSEEEVEGDGDETFKPALATQLFRTVVDAYLDLDNNDDEFNRLGWMKQHPELCCEDQPDIDNPFKRNKMWFAASQAFGLPYWHRAWVFQEIYLAKELLLCTRYHCCEAREWQFAALLLSNISGEIKKQQIPEPRFIANSIWNLLSCAASFFAPLNRLVAALKGRSYDLGTSNLLARWHLSFFGSQLRTSKPEDHIYALLALTQINMTPNCSTSVSVRTVYRDYIKAWLLDYHENVSEMGAIGELYFLQFAGIGTFSNQLRLPTWAPNFPEGSRCKIMYVPPLAQCAALEAIFPSPKAPAAVLRFHLRCEGLRIDTITHLSDLCHPPLLEGSIVLFLKGYVSRHPLYVTGIHPLQALLRVLTATTGNELGRPFWVVATILFVLILRAVSKCEVSMADIGLPVEEKARVHNIIVEVLEHIFPGCRQSAVIDTIYTRINAGPQERSLQVGSDGRYDDALHRSLLPTYGHRVYETSKGYLGLTREHTRPGDLVYILKGCDWPAVLRQDGDNIYSFVNLAFSVGLEDGRAAEIVRREKHAIRSLYLH